MRALTIKTLVPYGTREVELRHLDPDAVFRWVMANDRLSVTEYLPTQNRQRLIRFRLKSWFRPLISYMWVHFDPASLFRIKQDKGVFCRFEYCVSCSKVGEQTEIADEIHFELNHRWFFYKWRMALVEKILKKVVQDKNAIIQQELALLRRYPSQIPLKILILGSHGFVGHALDLMLGSFGHKVYRAVRSKEQLSKANTVLFNDENGEVNRDAFEGFDAFINLAGANIADKRWTKKRCAELYQSRVFYTQKLAKLILSLDQPPKTVISSSAVGFYGSEVVGASETTAKGEGFLSDLANEWEKAAKLMIHRECRLVIFRFGVILGRGGGMLQVFDRLAKWWLLGPIGSGDQKLSWIAHQDVLGAIYYGLISKELVGTYNLVAQDHPSQKKLAQLIMRTVHSKMKNLTPPAVPRWVVEIIFGNKMAAELFFCSQIVSNQKLLASGYVLSCPNIQDLILELTP